MKRPLALSLAAAVLLAATASAQVGIPYVGQIVHADAEASLMVSPDGTGTPFNEAYASGGWTIDATVRVRLVDIHYDPVGYFPPEDMWLRFPYDPGTVASCVDHGGPPSANVFHADHPTDSDGWTEFALPLRGGGWSEGPATVYLNGYPAFDPWGNVFDPVPLRMNSPDVNGDLVVDLSDIALFAQIGFDAYDYRVDFRWDGDIDLSDVVLFVAHLGAGCE